MIQDEFLYGIAKLLNSESFTVPSHLAVGTTDITEDVTHTTLSGEFRTREALTSSRVDNVTTYNAVVSGADVVDTTNGDTLEGLGFFNASSSGTMCVEVSLPSLLQTTAYDIDVDLEVTVSRAS